MSEFKIRRLGSSEIKPSYGPRFAGVHVDKDTGELWVNADGTQRKAFGPDPQTVAALGTNQGTAAPITYASGSLVNVTGGDGTVGVILPALASGVAQVFYIYNNSGAVLKIYPASGDNINGGSANAAVSVAAKVLATFISLNDSTWTAVYTVPGTYATLTGAEELTNKTLTDPVIASINSDLSVVGTVESADATTPILSTAAGKTNTGYLSLAGKTSGSLKVIAADAAAQVVTVSLAAQTSGAATVTIPDRAGVSGLMQVEPQAPVAGGSSLSVTAAAHANRTLLFDTAAGTAFVLPAATGSGVKFRFVVSVAPTSNQHRITCTGDDRFAGVIHVLDRDAAAQTAYFAAVGTDNDRIDMPFANLEKGGQVGDWIEVQDVKADFWAVTGSLQCVAGQNPASPFATGAAS